MTVDVECGPPPTKASSALGGRFALAAPGDSSFRPQTSPFTIQLFTSAHVNEAGPQLEAVRADKSDSITRARANGMCSIVENLHTYFSHARQMVSFSTDFTKSSIRLSDYGAVQANNLAPPLPPPVFSWYLTTLINQSPTSTWSSFNVSSPLPSPGKTFCTRSSLLRR